ncbi:hypothetical protein [Geodermatophilus sp. URMC 64]
MKLEDILRSIGNDDPMGLEELRHAVVVLREHAHTGTPGVLEARLRVATRLERLSR